MQKIPRYLKEAMFVDYHKRNSKNYMICGRDASFSSLYEDIRCRWVCWSEVRLYMFSVNKICSHQLPHLLRERIVLVASLWKCNTPVTPRVRPVADHSQPLNSQWFWLVLWSCDHLVDLRTGFRWPVTDPGPFYDHFNDFGHGEVFWCMHQIPRYDRAVLGRSCLVFYGWRWSLIVFSGLY